MKGSLKKYPSSIKDLKKEASSLKDEVVAAFGQYSKMAKEHVIFFYSNLDLSRIDMFNVVQDGWLVDDE